jgi:uncharacterized protein YeaO (DUF488 family)
MVKIWTAQYKYGGNDRFDITVGTNANAEFAPTWEIVKNHKSCIISDEEYTKIYLEKMRISYMHHRWEWNRILNMDEITFVCFCKANNFCHRYLLANLFVNLGAIYMGERKIKRGA